MVKACKIDDRYLAFCFDEDAAKKLCDEFAEAIVLEAQIKALTNLNIDDELDEWNS
jgi:hypothetical protein